MEEKTQQTTTEIYSVITLDCYTQSYTNKSGNLKNPQIIPKNT